MLKLRIKSKTTLQKLRDEGLIKFSLPNKKIILYSTDSINEYLEKHSKENFRTMEQGKHFQNDFKNRDLMAKHKPVLFANIENAFKNT